MFKGAKNILVVGSDEDMCWLLKKVFQNQNCRIRTSNSLKETLNAVSEKMVDLVLLDSPLNNISSNEILRCIRTYQPNTPIIVIGHYGNEGLLGQMQEWGNCEFVAKPFVIENLIKIVKQVLFSPAKKKKEKSVKHLSQVQIK